jgi:hypothetical protein
VSLALCEFAQALTIEKLTRGCRESAVRERGENSQVMEWTAVRGQRKFLEWL